MSNQLGARHKIHGVVLSIISTMACLPIILLCGCTPTTKIQVNNSANVPDAAKLKRVAVYPFEGRYGDVYRAEIESLLVSAEINGKHTFSVVESAKLDSIIKAQRLGSVYDESTVANVGKLVGAQGVFMGTVDTDLVADTRYTVSTRECTYKNNDGKCKKWRDVSVPCTRRTANVGFNIRLVNVETGIQSYNRAVSGQAVAEYCRGSNRPLEDKVAVLKRARQVAYGEVRKDVAPYAVDLDVKLMSDTDGIDSDRAKLNLKSGLLFAKAGRLDRACELWQEARTLAPRSTAIIYNIGVCAESAGELDNALALYQEADRRLLKPEPIINEALNRVQNRLNKAPVGP